ncbi:MAG: ROK family protein [Elusimicrobia bacterium]|nr:ROK family protein [Elusimicrobiota bacterium]
MKHAIAVDIGGTKTSVVLMDSDFKTYSQVDFPTPRDYEDASEKIRKTVENLDPKGNLPIGIALCGLLSRDNKELLLAPNLSWKNLSLKELFHWIDGDFKVVNDGTAAAWASYILGGKKDYRLLSVTFGTGVGGGLVMYGNLILGAGELGHIKLDPQGAACGCGSRGCLETFAGGRHLPSRALEWEGLNVETACELGKLANDGSEAALRCFKKMGSIAGYALAGVVNLNGIGTISIGGGLANASGHFFMDSLKESLKENLMVPDKQNPTIHFSQSKRNMSLMGAGAVVINPPPNLQT